ncbi:DamX protein [Paraglaciecola aquimarina]|uniref:DamX protein n=1 Tax=Paraglaciecola algarum TaxID=3050085 RepID=A0ABS9D3Y2_9ALTE|nr:DamX protein [Paraglaciecola sp. G1-23]MCF2947628.1 DamX protein [Paraglaciecola sp. G1-23]
MATSELSNRLECLTSFSSQLVFVCSDKVKQQSQVVESFIGNQNEDTNLALITANELTPLVSYRETLFRQLINNEQSVDFNLPLNQLLASLNKHDGPVLISVFQADKLPIKLVKEIWELVLQSRFAKNKQHLNILLMGQSGWAEKMKNGLGARSKEKPIILNGQSANSASSDTNVSNISHLSNSKPGFYEPLNTDHTNTPAHRISFKKWAAVSLISLIFLVSFAGLLYGLYSDQIKQIFTNSVNQVEQLFNEDVITKHEPNNNLEPITSLEITSPNLELTKTTPQTPIDELVNSQDSSSSTELRVGSEVLVTDWQTASNKLTLKNNQSFDSTQPIEELSLQPAAQGVKEITTSAQSSNEDTQAKEQLNDYPVTDIPVVELAPLVENKTESTIKNNPISSSLSSTSSPSSLPSSSLASNQAIDSNQVKINSQELTDSSSILMALDKGRFVIQIAAMSNFDLLLEYVTDKKLSEHLWLYKTQRYGGDWYVLIYNQSFTSIEKARLKIEQLPADFLDNTPFAKSVNQVQQEIPNL